MLDTLPSEILIQIAHFLVLETGAPPTALLRCCNTIYTAASPESNPNLYAGVFRALYDLAAPVRRLGMGSGCLDDEDDDQGDGEACSPMSCDTEMSATPPPARPPTLRSRQLCAELRTRTRALTRLAKGITVLEEDLWIVFLMLLENDGKNITHLVNPLGPGPGVDMVALITSFHRRTLIWKDRYPPERAVDSLAMWIAWLLDEHSTRTTTTLRNLRPYVFAAHVYDLFFAPWILLDLPAAPVGQPAPAPPNPFMVDRVPRSRGCVVPSYGRELHLATPLLSHAAMLRFFSGPQDPAEPSSASAATLSEFAFDVAAADLREFPRPAAASLSHDADYARLLACHDGQAAPGRPISAWRGVFGGAWEGTFTFLDYDAFRDMLSGIDGTKPVYSGPYGEQAQVWKLRETFIRPTEGSGHAARSHGIPLTGPMTNAGFPEDLREFAADPISGRAPGTSPEDATIDDALARQLEALDGYEAVPEGELPAALAAADAAWEAEGVSRRRTRREQKARDEEEAVRKGKGKMTTPATLPPADAPAHDHDHAHTLTPDPDHLALLVTGVGHSAWGRFIISGHVRPWDGLVYLVKEYAPFPRGKWVYRGYVLSDNVMVGRWRDTVTEEVYVGYEGTFVLNRR